MAHAPVARLGRLLGTLYLVGSLGLLLSAFGYAVFDPAPSPEAPRHALASIAVVLSWAVLVAAALLTIVRGRRAVDTD